MPIINYTKSLDFIYYKTDCAHLHGCVVEFHVSQGHLRRDKQTESLKVTYSKLVSFEVSEYNPDLVIVAISWVN